MNKDKTKSSGKTSSEKVSKVGQLFPNASLEDYAKVNRIKEAHDDGEICESKYDSEDDVSYDQGGNNENEDCDDHDDHGDDSDEEVSG